MIRRRGLLIPTRSREPWTLENLLSGARLGPYLAATADDLKSALRLYEWNARISAAFHQDLSYVEVGLRNAMDGQLSSWASALGATGSWYVAAEVPLKPPTRRRVDAARAAVARQGQTETHGKVVAELTFGFWWSLLAAEYNRQLWQPCLRNAFDGPVRRARLHAELNELRILRNRIAHHEPIHRRALIADHHRILDVADRISPCLNAQILSVSQVPGVLAGRPRGTGS